MSAERKTQRGIRLNVKLTPGIGRQQLGKVWSETPGLRSAIQTFPDETDQELSRLYIIEVDPSNLKAALRQLRHNPYIEYAEETARHKLIW